MMTLTHECVACKQSYKGCDYCNENRGKAFFWRNICCSRECYMAYTVWTEYRANRMSEDEAIEKLREIGVNKIETLDVEKYDRSKTKRETATRTLAARAKKPKKESHGEEAPSEATNE